MITNLWFVLRNKMKFDIHFVLTKNCNLKCSHCYLSASPGQQDTTMPLSDFKKAIGNLPKDYGQMLLSGGEVFTIPNFYDYLDVIKKENEERGKFNQGKIDTLVQTNGSWATDDKKIMKILNELHKYEVKGIGITSEDKFHINEGIKLDNLYNLEKLALNSKFFDLVKLCGSEENVIPLGRAAKLNLPFREYNEDCSNFLEKFYLTIREEGSVSHCCYNIFKLPGNLIHEPLTEIISKAEEDERLSILNLKEGGIDALALYDGWPKKALDRAVNALGKCGVCFEFYGKRKSKDEIMEKVKRLRRSFRVLV